jgi:hypothetical protein
MGDGGDGEVTQASGPAELHSREDMTVAHGAAEAVGESQLGSRLPKTKKTPEMASRLFLASLRHRKS